MAAVSWSSAGSGNWSLGTNWEGGAEPGPGDDALITVGGAYTVSLTAAITVASIAIGDSAALLQIQDPGGDDVVTGDLDNAGSLEVDSSGAGGSTLTVGGTLTNMNYVRVGNGGMTTADLLTVDGTFGNTGGALTVEGGGTTGATAQVVVAGAVPGTLTGTTSIYANAGGASVQWGSGGITQIGDGASNGGDLYLDGANAYAEIGATDSNSAIAGLATIAGNGLLDLRDGVTLTTTGSLTVAGGGRLKVDAYGGNGGSDVTIGGNLLNLSTGSFGDGGVSVGNSGMSTADTLTVDGSFTNAGAITYIDGGGVTGATAQIEVTGAAPGTLTGTTNIVADTGGASLQWGSGGITQIGDGASNSGDLYLDGANAYAEIGATNSNSALTGLATIAGNGLLDLRDGVTLTTTGSLTIDGSDGRLKVDAYGGSGGSDVTIGGDLVNLSTGSFGDGGVAVGNSGMSTADALLVDGSFTSTGAVTDVTGGRVVDATAQMVVTGAVPGTLTGTYNIVADTGGAFLQWGSGGITQIGDGASNGGDLYLDGANAYAEIGATDSNSALTGLATIAGNGLLDLRDGVTLTTTGSLTIDGSDGRLKVDAYGGSGGSDVTIGGNLLNLSTGSFGDGGVSVGNSGMSTADTLTVDGSFTNAGAITYIDGGGVTGATAQIGVTGAAPGTLTGTTNIVADTGGASLQWGSGGITQIGDGASNGGDLYLDGANAYAEIGATDSNSALTGLATIAGNGLLDLRDGVTLTTTGSLTIDGSDGRLKVDAYGGSGGSDVTIGGNLVNLSTGSFGDGGVSVGGGGMQTGDTLTVDGTLANTGAVTAVYGGNVTGATARLVVTGAVPGTLTGTYDIVADTGGASLQWGSGGITQIGDGASNGGDLYLDGANAYAEIGATDSNRALTGLATIAGNGLLDLRDGVTLTTTGSLTIDGSDGRLKVDAYGGSGGSDVTIGGNLVNLSTGSFGDGGVSVGGGGMQTGDTLTVDGTLANTGAVTAVYGGNVTGATARLVVTGAVPGTLTGTYNIVADTGGASLQWGSGGITQIGDGTSNGGDLYLDGANAYAEIGATNSNSALTGLATIAGNGLLDLRDGVTLTTTGSLTIDGSDGRLKVDAYGGSGGSNVTIGGDLVNLSSGNFGDGGVAVGGSGMTQSDLLTVDGELSNGGGDVVTIEGNPNDGGAGQAVIDAAAVTNAGAINIDGNGLLDVAPGNTYTQTGGSTFVSGTLAADSIALNAGAIDLSGGHLTGGTLSIASGASLSGFGTVTPAITGGGSIVASGGVLDLAGGLVTALPISIEGGAELNLAGADSGAITFAGASGILELDQPMGFTGTISGLAVDDTIVLDNIQANGATATYDSGNGTSTLAVSLVGGGTLDLTLAGDYANEAFGTNRVGNDTQLAAVGAAVGVINTPLPVALGRLRQGATTTLPLSITNNAPTGSAALDVTIGALSGDAIGAGTIVALAPGATDTTDITVGIDSFNGGVQTGTVTLDFASDLGGGNQAPLPSESVALSGTIYSEAIAAITPLVTYVHVGDSGLETLDVANIAPANGYSEDLIAELTGATGGFTVASAGPTGDIAPGTSNAVTLGLTYTTAQAGVVSGDALVSLVSDGGTGAGSIDGFGTVALPSQAVPVTIDVDNYATAAIQPPADFGTLSTSGAAATLDLGTIAENTGLFDINFGVANAATGPSDLLSGSFIATAANGFALGALGPFSNVAASQSITAGVTLDTSVAGVVTQTITIEPTDSNPGGYSAPLAPQTLTVTGTVEVLPPPTITAASTLAAMTDVPALLGLTIGDPNTDTLPLTVTISDTSGSLTAAIGGSVNVAGNGTNLLTLTGDLDALNEELASVAYTGAAIGADTIEVSVEDQHHASASQAITVGISPVPDTKPVFNSPTTEMAVVGTATGYGGLSISDPSAEATGAVVSVGFVAPSGTLEITGNYGGTIIGQGTGTVEIIGTVPQINEYLSDGLLGDIGNSLGGIAFGYLQGFIRKGTITIGTEDLVTLGGGPEGKFFELGVTSATYAIDSLIGLIPGNTPPSQAQFIQDLVDIIGDPHIVAANGAIYDFNAEGEFVLAAATQPGDSFDVQVRLQSFDNSPYASAVTQVAAQVGTDRVTFATGRADAIWIDGAAATLATTGSITLSGGIVTQVSDDSYRISWDTGEVLNVTDAGSFLDVSIAPGPNNGVGSLVGLATLADTPADEFQLVDGSILDSPLSSATLYGPYAEAWQVPQADSLFDYAPGQSTATFDNTSFPAAVVTLADLPASVVAQAASVVAAAGITDPGAAAAIEFDYIVSGGDPSIVAADASYLAGDSTTSEQATPSGPAPVAIGVIADQAQVVGSYAATTPVVFDVYLTAPSETDEVISYAAVASAMGDLGAGAFGGTLPTGFVTIAAGQVSSQFTIDIPTGGLGLNPDSTLAVQIAATDGTPAFAPDAQATIVQAIPGPPAIPVITDLTNLGNFSGSGTAYTLNLGQVQYGEPLPSLQFEIENAAISPSDLLGGTFTVAPVEGFTVTGTVLPAPLGGGASYQDLDVTVNSVKFGPNSETITFDPTDSNVTGYDENLSPITLTVYDTIVPPTMVFSEAWGDVHIITYNGLAYNFQAEGEFTLAQSRIPGDSFDIQMRLQPLTAGASVTVITQVAVSVGTDTVTFDSSLADTVYVDNNPSTITQSDPVVNLDGGTLTQISATTWQVNWNTGEEATISEWGNSFFDITDGIPLSEPDMVGGLQGEDAGPTNDFQLSDGTVLQQPLTSSELYGEFADSWRVTAGSSLFYYLPGQSTATFTNTAFPLDLVSLSDLPTDLVTAAAQTVTDAGITDPGIAQEAELDYIATGNPAFIAAAQQISTEVTNTTPITVQSSTPPVVAVGVQANPIGYTEATSGPTQLTFDAYLTSASATDTVVDYTVVAAGAGFVDAATFGGTLPSGSVTITAGQTLTPFTIDLPQGALGTVPDEQLEVQVSAPGGAPLFAPQAVAAIANNTAEPGVAPIPQLLELTHTGTLIENSPTSYTLNLGTLSVGQASAQVQLALANDASPPADELSGTFSPPTGTGFLITGDDLPGAITAGEQYDGIYVATETSNVGQNSETLVFKATDVNQSGYVAPMAPITLTITDSVIAPGVGQLNTPNTIVFPNVHVGTPESQMLDVSNTGSAAISVAVSAADPILVQGSIAALGAGITDTSDLSVGVDTSSAGAFSGAADVNFGATDPAIDVFGDVYRLASGTVAPVTDFVHVNGSGTVALDISNTATADGFSENLLGTLAAVTGNFGIAAAGPTGEIAAGSSDTSSLRLDFSTAQVGTITGTAMVNLVSDGGTGVDSIDGLGTTDLAAQVVPVTVTVQNYANPVFEDVSGAGTFSQNGTTYALDLGTIAEGSGAFVVDLGVLNDVAGPADLAFGTITVVGSSAFTTSGTAAFSGLAAGQADIAPMVTLATGTPGVFSETLTLVASGTNASGYLDVLPDQTLTVTGTIVAALSGDVTLTTATEGIALPGTTVVADFSDPDLGDAASDFIATIDWGDGSPASTGTVTGSDGSFSVTGGHTYTNEGNDTAVVTIADISSTQTIAPSGSVVVADAPITATGDDIAATEGASTGPVTLATFTDANPNATAAQFTATINWGDGSPATIGTVTLNNGTFSVDGSHTYAEAGDYTTSVSVGDAGGSTATATGTIAVADAPLIAIGDDIAGAEGTSTGSVMVATFTDANPDATVGDFTATINWGDGSPATTGIVTLNNGTFSVDGTHTYAEDGSYTTSVSIDDIGGSTATASGDAMVSGGTLAVMGDDILATEGMSTGSVTVATFTDANPSDTAGNFTATIDWGDGSPVTAGIITLNDGTFSVDGTHTYAEAGDYAIDVTNKRSDGLSFAAIGAATVADAPLIANGDNIVAKAGVTTGSVAVGTFTDVNPDGTASEFTATINWGDGSPATAGTVIANGGSFTVDGAHTYTDQGNYTLGVMIDDVGGSSATASSTGTVYREAAATLLPIDEVVHVGDPGTTNISVTNTDPNDGYSEALIAALASTSGGIGIAAGGPTADIAPGGSTSTLGISFSTATAGTITGNGTIALTSDGGTGPDSIDGLGQTALAAQVVPVSITVNNYATAQVTSDGSLTAAGPDSLVLNLGTATEGAAALTADLNVLNSADGPADWLDGGFVLNGDTQFANSGFDTFAELGAGGSLDAGSVSLSTGKAGSYRETIELSPTDGNVAGYDAALAAQTITIVGSIVAAGTGTQVGTAQGDVHMVTFDGQHYDFQAVGDFVLARSTVPGDNFQIQIQTAAEPANNAVSVTTQAAAQIGADVVTFAIGRGSIVWIDGQADTSLSMANPVQNLAAGQLTELSPSSFQLTWTTGQSLTITDSGAYLNSSVALGAGNGAGSVQGLLGTDSGQASDFQLPDGTVIPQPVAASELTGSFAEAWSVTPSESLLDDAQILVPASATAGALDPPQFLDGFGQTVPTGITMTEGQGALGAGTVIQGVLGALDNQVIANFMPSDLIDVLNLASAATSAVYAASGNGGVLHLTDGALSGNIYLAGTIAGGSVHLTSDGHGGTLVGLY